jgi:hypothetical protein
MPQKDSAEKAVRDIRRKTHRKFSAEEKIRIVLEGLPGTSNRNRRPFASVLSLTGTMNFPPYSTEWKPSAYLGRPERAAISPRRAHLSDGLECREVPECAFTGLACRL